MCGHTWLSLSTELAAWEGPASEGCCWVLSRWRLIVLFLLLLTFRWTRSKS